MSSSIIQQHHGPCPGEVPVFMRHAYMLPIRKREGAGTPTPTHPYTSPRTHKHTDSKQARGTC